MTRLLSAFMTCCLILALNAPTSATEPFELNDGDRVLFVGSTFVEREGNYGYIETALTSAWPDRKITFRNLGWSGDTVWADSRGIFDPPAEGYKRMLALIAELRPTVIFFAYGANESFAGDAGLDRFVKQYEKLCDDVKSTNARIVFMTPPPFERPKPPLPDTSLHNPNLEKYAEAVRQICERRNGRLLDLLARVKAARPSSADKSELRSLTQDGSTLNPFGYHFVASEISADLQLPKSSQASLMLAAQAREGTNWQSMKSPEPLPPIEHLRRKIVEKNLLFFHRWRPQNITYLTGFRKHEQGNNAVEIAQFDPLVAKAEGEITAQLKSKSRE